MVYSGGIIGSIEFWDWAMRFLFGFVLLAASILLSGAQTGYAQQYINIDNKDLCFYATAAPRQYGRNTWTKGVSRQRFVNEARRRGLSCGTVGIKIASRAKLKFTGLSISQRKAVQERLRLLNF